MNHDHERLRWARTINEAFGVGSPLTVLEGRNIVRQSAEALGYIAAGLVIGGAIATAMYWGYHALCWCLS